MSTKEFGTDRKSEINLTYLSIGSNIGDRIKNLSSSRLAIEKQVGNLVYESKVYETEPWGYKEQGFFLNQIVDSYLTLILLYSPHFFLTILSLNYLMNYKK